VKKRNLFVSVALLVLLSLTMSVFASPGNPDAPQIQIQQQKRTQTNISDEDRLQARQQMTQML